MRFLPSLATGALVAALAAGAQVPAFASPAIAASQCQRLQGLLTSPDLCVSVQASSSSVRPGNTVGFVVGVSVAGGSAASVTVKLSASSGAADITGGCPAGNGSASCWIATMNVLGTPSGYTLDVSAPGGSAGSSVTLNATASAATLLSSTPPSAGVSVPVVAPSPSPSHSRSPSTSRSPAPGRSSSGAPGQGRSPSGNPSPRVGASVGAVGAVGSVGFTGTFPPADTGVGTSVVQPGNASGIFPTIGPSGTTGSGAAPRVGAIPDAYRSGLPLAPIGLVVALVMGAAWFALAGLGPFRRWRAGRADTRRQ